MVKASAQIDLAPENAASAVATLRAPDDFDRDVWSVLGIPVDALSASGAVAAIERAVRERRRLSFITPNVNFLVRAMRDSGERQRLVDADLSLVDGAPLVAIARLLGMTGLERCAGADVFEALRRRPAFTAARLSVFFFGGREGASEAAAAALDREGRGLRSAGWLNPGYGDVAAMSAPEIIETINAAKPDFLVVALGASKGQAWIDANLSRLDVPVVSHLGAVVDFTAGTIKRAPSLLQRVGLEWAWRIKTDPGLWRRYRDDAAGLCRLLTFRLAPSLATGRRSGAPAAARLISDVGGSRVLLSGDLCADDLKAVRLAYRAAGVADGDVIVDLTGAGAIDAAFLGLTLMLEKAARRRGAVVRIAGASARHRAILRANAMTYERAHAVGAGAWESRGNDAGEAAEAGIAAAQ
ncbi:MAG: WecB/TagA/CpsF family glycosyltransferase [Parvularculaceae bacterium]